MGKKEIAIILLGIVLGIGIGIALVSVNKRFSATNNIVAPYYDKKAFVPPKDLDVPKALESIKLPILMYHYVEYVSDVNDLVKKKLTINPVLFEEQLRALKKNEFETYFIKDVPDILAGTKQISSRSAILTFDDGYEDFYTIALPLLKKYNMKSTLYVIYNFIGRKGFLSKRQVQEIVADGNVEIGSHTFDHVYLKYIPKSVAKVQIEQSKKKFEDTFGIEIKSFAYPYGAFSKETMNLVKEASYSAAVSVIPGVIQSTDNLFYLQRLRAGMFTEQNFMKVLEKWER